MSSDDLRSLPRIYIVDDEPITASTLASILNLSGFKATSFTNPLEALQSALANGPDLLISDVVMPILNGIELAIQLKATCPTCEILLISGRATASSLLEDAFASGHDFDFLPRPIHPNNVIRQIRTMLGKSNPSKWGNPPSIEQSFPGVGNL